MMEETQSKLQILLDKHTSYRADFQGTITGWSKSLRKAIAIKKFGENDVIKEVRAGLDGEIREINTVLLYKEGLTTEERNRLCDKRGMYMQFLNLFLTADRTIDTIDSAVSYELGIEKKEDVEKEQP